MAAYGFSIHADSAMEEAAICSKPHYLKVNVELTFLC
jgi:hypothetical protein